MVHLRQKPFPCPDVDPVTGKPCTQAFDTAGHLRAHQGRLHGGARFICTECSQPPEAVSLADNGTASRELGFPTYALLQQHLRSAHPPTCPHCSTTCSSTKELRRHLELTHGNVTLEERKIHRCEYPDCDRSFTKKGNLTVHIKTVHEGERRFACGETDLSTSNKVTSWNPADGCGKRYGSKLALEEHVRTAHLGFKNAKAERREQLGLNKPGKRRGTNQAPSTLATLTGEGYVEESGRHIPCFVETCEHLFIRDYDLWLHMSGTHGFEEDDIQAFFMWRTMQGNPENYGVGSSNNGVNDGAGNMVDDNQYAYSGQGDSHMWDMYTEQNQVMVDQYSASIGAGDGDGVGNGSGNDGAMIPNTNSNDDSHDMSLIDPVLTYMMEE
jgi:general transcription factor IIIA